MSLNVIDGRIVEKISTVSGAIPTIGPSFDHLDGTWTELDIYEGEYFINVADGKIFTRVGTTIIELTTSLSSGDLATVLLAGNSTGTNDIIINTDQYIYNTTSTSSISVGTTSSPSEITIESDSNIIAKSDNGTNSSYTQIDTASVILNSLNSSGDNAKILVNGFGINLESNDGLTETKKITINPSGIEVSDYSALSLLQINDLGLVLPNFITPTSSADTIGIVGQVGVDDDYVYVKTTTGWKRSALTTFLKNKIL